MFGVRLHLWRFFAPVIGLIAIGGCTAKGEWNGSLEDLLSAQPERFGQVLAKPEEHRVQIIYTQIDRDRNNNPSFRSYTYRLDPDEYFYPASTVKLPVALLALEKLHRLNIPGLDRDTAMLTDAVRPLQTPATHDESAPGGLPSVAHYVRKIFLVSDNDAFNRLYELLGQEEINESLRAKGLADTRILHRLEIVLDVEENRHTNPVRFVGGGDISYSQPAAYSPRSYAAASPEILGRAEVVGGELLERPKDFAEKNAFALNDLHDVLVAVLFPDSVPPERRFGLTEGDYRLVYRAMSDYPGDSGIPDYADAQEYPQNFVKYLMFGGSETAIPDNIRIFNKIGQAYGFMTDAAYIVDFDNGIEFILAATVYTNENQTFNDGEYEYDEIAYPFLRNLGQAIYELELERERPYPPDLSRFDVNGDRTGRAGDVSSSVMAGS